MPKIMSSGSSDAGAATDIKAVPFGVLIVATDPPVGRRAVHHGVYLPQSVSIQYTRGHFPRERRECVRIQGYALCQSAMELVIPHGS